MKFYVCSILQLPGIIGTLWGLMFREIKVSDLFDLLIISYSYVMSEAVYIISNKF